MTTNSPAIITAGSTTSSVPSQLPKIIQPQTGVAPGRQNDTLIQIGFTYGLNYPFVVANPSAVTQIFNLLPPAMAYSLNIGEPDVVMQYLQPYNTLRSLGFITTLAMAYIPNDQLSTLAQLLLDRNSSAYNHPNTSVSALMKLVVPTFPLPGTPANAHPGDTTSFAEPDSSSGSALPHWGIALTCVGAVVLGLVAGVLFWVRRRKLTERLVTDIKVDESKADAETVSKYSEDKAELPANTWNMTTGRVFERIELVTDANRHELALNQSKVIRYELEDTQVQNIRTELGNINMHTERSELALSSVHIPKSKLDL